MRTIAYVDGFNLYYRALRNRPYKWLDLGTLFQRVLSQKNQLIGIKYFTAKVSGNNNDAGKPIRQQTYLRALAPLANPGLNSGQPPQFARIIKTEEKGSDVNLATHLLNDTWLDAYDCGVVVSNDSDIGLPPLFPCEFLKCDLLCAECELSAISSILIIWLSFSLIDQ